MNGPSPSPHAHSMHQRRVLHENQDSSANQTTGMASRISPQHSGIQLDTHGIDTEIRRDYLHDYYVIISPNRGKRPYDVKTSCRALMETAQSPRLDRNMPVWELNDDRGNWLVKVTENKYPSLTPDNPKAFGKQEIVIDTVLSNTSFSRLSEKQIGNILTTYKSRITELLHQTGIEYVLVFRNDGYESGASLAHAHSQIFALPIVPQKFQRESKIVEEYVKTNQRDPYEDIIAYEKSHKSRVVHEDDYWIVFCPYASQWPFEVWIMPKRAICSFSGLEKHELELLAHHLKQITKKLTRHEISYNFFLENGVSTHHRFTLKICGRSNIWGGFEVATGIVINTVPPESAAKWYRG